MLIVNATAIGQRLSGIGRYALSIVDYFLRWGVDFRIFVNEQALGHFQSELRREVDVAWRGISPDFGFPGHLLRLLWTNKLCLSNKDCVVFNTSPLEGCFFHAKQILTIHDLIPIAFPHQHRKQYFYFRYAVPIILKKTTIVITVSNFTKRLVMQMYGVPETRIRVIYNGISQIFLDSQPEPARGRYVLYVGRLSETKNIPRLLKAFEILTGSHKLDVTLKLVGDQRSVDVPDKIKDKVEFICGISDDELVRLYKNAALFVFPSLSEGFGLPPLEAMACGCPVVVSTAAALPEVCGDAAYYVDPYSVESIAEGMYRLATDDSLREHLIRKGRDRAKLFSWEVAARQHLSVLEEVLAGP